MKLFTHCFSLLAIWMLPSLLATATTITVQVGDNFYQGPSGTSTITLTTSDANNKKQRRVKTDMTGLFGFRI